MEVSRSRKGKADVAGNCSSAFLLFRAFKLCYNKTGNSRKKKMRPVGFMMRRYRNYEKIFNGNKAELASAPQSALAPQCLCGFSRLVLQDFRPVRGLIRPKKIGSFFTMDTTCKTFAPSGDWYLYRSLDLLYILFCLQDFRPVRGLILKQITEVIQDCFNDLQDFRPVRGLIHTLESFLNDAAIASLQDFRPVRGLILLQVYSYLQPRIHYTCKTFAPSGDWYDREQSLFS